MIMGGFENYSRALFELMLESGEAEAVMADCTALFALLSENGEYTRLLDSPVLPIAERLSMIDAAFGGMNENLVNLVKILAENRRAHLLPKILTGIEALYDEHMGIIRAEAVSAVALTEGQIAALGEKIRAITGKEAKLTLKVDRELLGGLILRFDGRQIDGSVKGRLDALSEKLRQATIN